MNEGVVDVVNGTLELSATTLDNRDRITVGSGAELRTGTSSSVPTENGGVVELAEGAVWTQRAGILNTGSIRGGGTIVEPIGVGGDTVLVNEFLLEPGPGVLTLDSLDLESTNGSLLVGIAGPPTTPGADFDQVAVVGGSAAVGDSVIVSRSFVPTVGDTYPVLVADVVTGTFAVESGLGPIAGVQLSSEYLPTELRLVAEPFVPPDVDLELGVVITDDVDRDGDRETDETVTYDLTVDNAGTEPATNIVLSGTAASQFDLVSAIGCTYTEGDPTAGDSYSCAIGDLAGGSSTTLRLVLATPIASFHSITGFVAGAEPAPPRRSGLP